MLLLSLEGWPMQESFGAKLRRRREEQDIALVTIAEQTKIKLSLLEALERDDVSHWPAGIFRRAFIRAYAHAIGLNPDDVVREFVEVHPEPADLVAAALAVAAEGERTQGNPPTRLRTMVDSAFGSLSRLRRPAAAEETGPTLVARVVAPAPAQFDAPIVAEAAPPDEEVPEVEVEEAVVSTWTPLQASAAPAPDLTAVAALCTEFGRVENAGEVQPLLEKAAALLDASGLIVWLWDPVAEELRPALVHGYSERVLAQLPAVRRDADNPTAAAFRTGEARAIDGGEHTSAALVLPLHAPGGSPGVLAIELQHGREHTAPVRAVATILAALLAQLVGGPAAVEVQEPETPAQRAYPLM